MTQDIRSLKATGKLRDLQLCELRLLKRFVEICTKHNLRYYLLGGTLLGAVRHDGFIPWDDDVDVCMPRPDYMRFLEIAEEELAGSDMGISSIYHDKMFRQGMAKMTTSSMQIINRSANVEKVEDAWIDVIPMDGMPCSSIGKWWYKVRLMYWKVMDATTEFDYVVDTKRDRGAVGNIAVRVLGFLCKYIHPYGKDFNRVFLSTERLLMKYDYESSDWVINMYTGVQFREIFPRSFFGQGTDIGFEGEILCAPENIPGVLQIIYGNDYMTPPPEGQRNWHNSEVL